MFTTDRRNFIKAGSAALLGSCVFPPAGRAAEPAGGGSGARYVTAAGTVSPHTEMATVNRRESFGWKVAGIPGTAEKAALEIRWKEGTPAPEADCRLRIALMDTSEMRNVVEVSLAGSGKVLGEYDLRKVSTFQPYELAVSREDAAAVVREGIRLRQTEGEQVLWVITGESAGESAGEEPAPAALSPHLLPLVKMDPLEEYFRRMDSLAVTGYFGWCEGCVLDGLYDLSLLPGQGHYRRMLERQLGLFFKEDGQFIYENPRGKPADNHINNIEGMLPWAALARVNPRHASFAKLEEAWARLEAKDADGCIIDGTTTTSEGAYTVGYVMAVLARQRNDAALARRAITQILVRQRRFFDGVAFTRVAKTLPDGTIKPETNRNWCRGITWQILGMARVIETLDGWQDVAEAKREFARLAAWVEAYQLEGGLWSVFVDEKDLTPDTGGSAGIAAALAIGVKHGWLPDRSRAAVTRAWEGLVAKLTPDGFLTGTSQSNWGGEGLQRGSYRVIYQMSMGLMAQCHAARTLKA